VSKIAFGTSSYRRDLGSMSELKVENMFAERTPSAQGQVVLMSRKGLVEYSNYGDGPVQGVFQQDGTFWGDRFELSGNVLYRAGVALGTVPGSGPVSWATSGAELVLTAGEDAYSYDGTDLEAVVFPDGSAIAAVDFAGSRFLYVPIDPPVGSLGSFYWSELNDGRDVDGANFATAESSPDGLWDLKVIRGNVYPIGKRSIEVWRGTSSADLPFQLIQQTIASKGAIATGCSVEADNALFWIGQDGILYRWGETPQQVSDPGLEERIISSGGRRLIKYDYEGKPLVNVITDDDVFAYDASTRQIHNPRSAGLPRFRANCAFNVGTDAYIGDETTGQIWAFDGWEDDGAQMERLFTAFFPIEAAGVSVNNLWIEANVGRTDLLAGQGSDPVVEMRSSNDAGATWSDWDAADLGEQGEYRTIVEWRAVGLFDVPGAMFEIRCSDPVGFRVSGVHVNDPIPGRSR
jgi:hypothetical protein